MTHGVLNDFQSIPTSRAAIMLAAETLNALLDDALDRFNDLDMDCVADVDADAIRHRFMSSSGRNRMMDDFLTKTLRESVLELMVRHGIERDVIDHEMMVYDGIFHGDGGGGGGGDDDASRESRALAFVKWSRRCATRVGVEILERHAAGTWHGASDAMETSVEAHGVDGMDVDGDVAARIEAALRRLDGGVTAGALDAEDVLRRATEKAREVMAAVPSTHTELLLDPSTWSAEQRELIERVHQALHEEYKVRREMIIKRAQVTTASFCFSPRLNAHKELREEFKRRIAEDFSVEPKVTMDDICDARGADLALVGIKVTAGSAGLNSSVKKIIMGAVPDRGGRTDVSDRAGSMPASTARAADSLGGGASAGASTSGKQPPKAAEKKKTGASKRW
jgi:hypothetical protein